MKCPLLMQPLLPYSRSMALKESDCLKEECAWWNEDYGCCQLVELVYCLGGIELTLKEIKGKIPQARQTY